jgi:hypothetical protein
VRAHALGCSGVYADHQTVITDNRKPTTSNVTKTMNSWPYLVRVKAS